MRAWRNKCARPSRAYVVWVKGDAFEPEPEISGDATNGQSALAAALRAHPNITQKTR